MGIQEYRRTLPSEPKGPRLFRMWQEDPERAASWMDDRVLSDAEVGVAKAWNGGESGRHLVAIPTSLAGEDEHRVVEVFGPLGTRDEGMPPEWIIYPSGAGGFVTEDFSGRRVASATLEAALSALLD